VDTLKKNIRTVLGKILQFYGNTFCAFALILEDIVIVKSLSDIIWKLGHWFYNQADKYAWSYFKTEKPVNKYG